MLATILEVYLRVNEKHPIPNLSYDKNTIWRFNSHLEEINSEGFRDRTFKKKKKEGVTRIMVLGDSYAAGVRIDQDKVFPRLLENYLNTKGSRQYEVLNVSVSAWATDQQLHYYFKEGKAYQPDYVLMMVAPNDLRESYNKKWVTLGENSIAWKPTAFSKKEIIRWNLASHFRLFNYFEHRWMSVEHGDINWIFEKYPVNFGKQDEDHWDLPLFLYEAFEEVHYSKFQFLITLKLFNEEVNSNGSKLLVSVVPTQMEFDGTLSGDLYNRGGIANEIADYCSKYDVPYLNLYNKSALLSNPNALYLSDDFHFNEQGHAFVARELLYFFED